MKIKSYLVKLTLSLSSLLLCFIIAEIGLRIVLFSDVNAFKELKNPDLYADSYSEDVYWELRCYLSKEPCTPKKPHPYLGWVIEHSVDRNNFKHKNADYINNRRPVLLYGDSFARCVATCFQDILNNDEVFSKDHYLLNYGMDGYGADQIYLLFKKSVDHYKNPLVIISLMTLDLDRSILSFRDGQKPHFSVENGTLKLAENSIYPDPRTFLSENKPRIISYVYRRILFSKFTKKYMPNQYISYLKNEDYYRNKKIQVNEKIILEILKELRSRKLNYVFLIFHPSYTPESGDLYFENNADWRDSFLRRILDENNVPYIWSNDIIKQNKVDNRSRSDFFLKDGHPTTYLNKILAERIKQYVLKLGE